MSHSVPLEPARAACLESIDAFLRAVDGFDEHALMGESRCHGWTRLDVVVHTIGGWQEMLGGLVAVVETQPTVDAASYWPAFADEYAGDPVATLMAQRRRTAAYARPRNACDHLREVASLLRIGVQRFGDQRCTWQGHVFAPGDYLAIWAVENAVHHLDLRSDDPAPAEAMAITRATVEALLGGPLPGDWSDEEAALVGAGRVPVPEGSAAGLAARLPVLG